MREDYYLTINIKANDRRLHDDLVVTLESVRDDLSGIKSVDIYLVDNDKISIANMHPDELREGKWMNDSGFKDSGFKDTGFNDTGSHDTSFLDTWMVPGKN